MLQAQSKVYPIIIIYIQKQTYIPMKILNFSYMVNKKQRKNKRKEKSYQQGLDQDVPHESNPQKQGTASVFNIRVKIGAPTCAIWTYEVMVIWILCVLCIFLWDKLAKELPQMGTSTITPKSSSWSIILLSGPKSKEWINFLI